MVAYAMKDPAFLQELLSNPRALLAREYHIHFPNEVTIRVLEEAPHTLILVLPAREEALLELPEADREAISGGVTRLFVLPEAARSGSAARARSPARFRKSIS